MLISQEEAAAELLLLDDACSRMLDFTTYTWPGFDTNWHHEVTCQYLDAFAAGEIENLMVFQPTQHGKSELCSRRLPAFLLGQNPDLKILAASYASELIQGMNRDIQRIIESAEYKRLFPDTNLNSGNVRTVAGSWLRNNDVFEIVGRRGSYRCAGVTGGLTGFACDIGILDDPYKDFKEAQSTTVRKSVWEWYTSVFLRRLHKRSRQLFVLTRWHEDDLAGRLLNLQPGRWTVLRLPGIKEESDPKDVAPAYEPDPRQIGEALWPARFDTDQLLMQKALNRYQFEAMTQQNPRPREGSKFKRIWFEGKTVAAVPLQARRVRRWDIASTEDGGDYTVGWLMVATQTGYIIEDIVRGQWDDTERDEIIKDTALKDRRKYGPTVKTIGPQDPGSAGKDSAKAFKKLLAGFDVDTERETGSKEVRARAFSSQCGAGNVFFLVDDEPVENFFDAGLPVTTRAEVVEIAIDELCAFPNGTHDDIVDAGSGAFNELALPDSWVHDPNVIEWLKQRVRPNAPQSAPTDQPNAESSATLLLAAIPNSLSQTAPLDIAVNPTPESPAPSAISVQPEVQSHGHDADVSPSPTRNLPTGLDVPPRR